MCPSQHCVQLMIPLKALLACPELAIALVVSVARFEPPADGCPKNSTMADDEETLTEELVISKGGQYDPELLQRLTLSGLRLARLVPPPL